MGQCSYKIYNAVESQHTNTTNKDGKRLLMLQLQIKLLHLKIKKPQILKTMQMKLHVDKVSFF